MAIFRDIQNQREHDRQTIRQGAIVNVSQPQTAEPPE
jgi:hypothetical protein